MLRAVVRGGVARVAFRAARRRAVSIRPRAPQRVARSTRSFSAKRAANVSAGKSTLFRVAKWGAYMLAGTASMTVATSCQSDISARSALLSATVTQDEVRGIGWVRLCTQIYPEINWLADESVRMTQEGIASAEAHYSEQLYGKCFAEFDRTLMTLRCLGLILDGSEEAYTAFTAGQKGEVRLSKGSFDLLHKKGELLLTEYGLSREEMRRTMETALILGDLGKSERARQFFAAYGASAPDHDDFYVEVVEILSNHPDLSPSYSRLSPEARCFLGETVHYGHLVHSEGGPTMFLGLKNLDPDLFDFSTFIHMCDVAGALGHVNPHSSIVFTEETYTGLTLMQECASSVVLDLDSEEGAYRWYLTCRAIFLGLNPHDRLDCTLAKVGAMLRLYTREAGSRLKEAISQLSDKQRALVMTQLEAPPLKRTPTYIPAVLVNFGLEEGVRVGLPAIAKVIQAHQKRIENGEADPNVPLNFNEMARVAKEDPEFLVGGEFGVDGEGNVYPLQAPSPQV